MLDRLKRRLLRLPPVNGAYMFFNPPKLPGLRLTPKRLVNLYMLRYAQARGHTKLRARPQTLTIESGNVCNLRCPGCFTGVEEVGRKVSFMPIGLYERLLDELGDYLILLEFYNWGEPLLNKDICRLIKSASEQGICTLVSTNFSIPFDSTRAEALVDSGLAMLGVSLDGAKQETYEQYRVRGDFEKVLQNCRLMNDAKRKLGASNPRMIWEFHVFEHNVDDIPLAREMAAELDMDISIDKGWTTEPEWNRDGEHKFFWTPGLERCHFLWRQAVVHNDGGVAPCCGTFYKEDDLGTMQDEAGAVGTESFMETWNNDRFQEARRLFRSGSSPGSDSSLVCTNCPDTLNWRNYEAHKASGKPAGTFRASFNMHDWFNYFFYRKPDSTVDNDPDVIELRIK